MGLYPLKFEPIYKPKVWGGRALEKLGRKLPAGELIGESWELADLGSTSASGGGGGGGGEARSRIVNGPLAGKTLHQAMNRHGEQMMGRLPPTNEGNFPLLVKFLDARQHLSVQVHPSPAYARQHRDAYLKSEAWYVVDADAGAVIYKGVKAGTSVEQFRAAIQQNRVEELLIEVPVKAGDAHYLPSGTCHALGAGIVVAEVQTPSDTTFRVYDWGRKGRQLHVEQALECIEYGPADTARFEPGTSNRRDRTLIEHLVRCEYFQMDRVKMDAGYQQALVDREPVVWMVLEGRGCIECEHNDETARRTEFQRGQTLLLAAAMGEARVAVDEPVTLLEVQFPQAGARILA